MTMTKLEKERVELIKEFINFIEKKYNEDDVVPESEYISFFDKNASDELKKFEKKRKNKYNHGIIVN